MSSALASVIEVIGWIALLFISSALVVGIFGGLAATWASTSKATSKRTFVSATIICASTSLIGSIVGHFAGASRTPAISDLLPALLTIIGSLISLLIAKDQHNRFAALAISLSLAIGTFIGATLGAQQRHSLKNTPDALEKRADLIIICKQQELRARQVAKIDLGAKDAAIDMKCDEYPRE